MCGRLGNGCVGLATGGGSEYAVLDSITRPSYEGGAGDEDREDGGAMVVGDDDERSLRSKV